MDYLLKPIRRERLAEAIRRVASEPRGARANARRAAAIETALEQPGLKDRMPSLKRLPVRHRREVRLLDLEQVPMVFSRDRLVLARAEGREYLVDYTLQELEQRLPEGEFVRVHRGALVNVRAIESFGGENGVLVLRLEGRIPDRGQRAPCGGGAPQAALRPRAAAIPCRRAGGPGPQPVSSAAPVARQFRGAVGQGMCASSSACTSNGRVTRRSESVTNVSR